MNNRPTPETDAAWDKYTSPPYTYWAGDLRILAQRLERERDEANHELNKKYIEYDKLFDVAELIKIERDQILDALMKIEEIFIDGADTYNDWLAMGSIARTTLEKLNK